MFTPHYTQTMLEKELDRFEFPKDFALGSSTAGYQVEGGINGAQEPKNNWYRAEQSGKAQKTGESSRFWDMYQEDFSRSRSIGLNAFRMGIEWTRLQPAVNPDSTDVPDFSEQAANDYAHIIADLYDKEMFPAVTLHHFTHPLWLGLDFWLDRDKVMEYFPKYVEFAVRTVNQILIEKHQKPPIPYYITINEPFMIPQAAYFINMFPNAGTKGLEPALQCYENMLIAHVLAYRTVHRIYQEMSWKRPTVTINTWCAAVYDMDRLAQDLFLARQNGIDRAQLPQWLHEKRSQFNQLIKPLPYVHGPQFLKQKVDNYIEKKFIKRFGDNPLPNLVDIIYDHQDPKLLDAVGFDYYDPFIGNYVDLGFPLPIKVRAKPWQWNVVPQHLGSFLQSYAQTANELPIHILENGMCYRHDGKKAYARKDGAKREDVLKATLYEMLKAMNDGINVGAYYYWSLIDNYEWGSFEPRFGLFGVDYDQGAKRMDTDVLGNNAAGAYSLFVQAMRNKDKAALKEFFTASSYPVIAAQ